MSVTEAQRHQLYESLKVTIGQENADTFMNLTPPTDWNDFATKDDVDRLATKISGVEQVMNARFDAVDARFEAIDQRFEGIDQRLDRMDMHFDRLEGSIDQIRHDVVNLRPELQRTLGTWIFASHAALVAAMSLLLAIMR